MEKLTMVVVVEDESFELHRDGKKVYTVYRAPEYRNRWAAFNSNGALVDVPDLYRHDLIDRLETIDAKEISKKSAKLLDAFAIAAKEWGSCLKPGSDTSNCVIACEQYNETLVALMAHILKLEKK